MEILILRYPNCSTCKKALKWLKDHKISYTERNIAEDNPAKKELQSWYKKGNYPLTKFFNTSGKIYKEQNLKEKVKTATEDELLTLLASDGMLVKRPLVISDSFILVGFNEEEWKEKLTSSKKK